MAAYVLWIDHAHAKCYKLLPGKIEMHAEKRHDHKHHTHGDQNQHKDDDKFFHAVAQDMKGAKEVLIVGPGLAKSHFKNHLEKHHHHDLAKAVVGTESVDDHVTENQILAMARKFFKTYDLFNNA